MAFKEPQPRKKAPGATEPGVNPWPPYAREGGEVNWAEKPISEAPDEMAETRAEQQRTANEFYSQPLMVLPDATNFQYRSTALEAAVRWYPEAIDTNDIIAKASQFEEYLRNGKPS